jgi:hypothetical protein
MTELLTSQEAAVALRRHPGTLAHWRKMGAGPDATPVGNRWMYERASLDRFLAQQTDLYRANSAVNRDAAAMRSNDDLAVRLWQMRLNAELTQAMLAEKLDIPLWKLRAIEHGTALPAEEIVSAWCWQCNALAQEKELLQMQFDRTPEVEEIQ